MKLVQKSRNIKYMNKFTKNNVPFDIILSLLYSPFTHSLQQYEIKDNKSASHYTFCCRMSMLYRETIKQMVKKQIYFQNIHLDLVFGTWHKQKISLSDANLVRTMANCEAKKYMRKQLQAHVNYSLTIEKPNIQMCAVDSIH